VPTAELAVALMLAAAKRIRIYDQKLRTGNWELRYKPDQSVLLAGRRVLIVGYGAIGRRVGDVLLALGLQVTGIRRNPGRKGEESALILPPSDLKKQLPGTDILILTLPLTSETRGLIGPEELEMLPERSIIVNVSRGPIINQEALYHALKNERIHGAGLDVWYNYPKTEEERLNTYPGDFPFHELENVVMSPHRGGKSPEVESARMKALADSLNSVLRGDELPNQVNIKLGY
jgi:phosphoglycerate dehydrogenase-like enzyme